MHLFEVDLHGWGVEKIDALDFKDAAEKAVKAAVTFGWEEPGPFLAEVYAFGVMHAYDVEIRQSVIAEAEERK